MLLDANIFQPLIDVFAAVLKFFHNDVGVSWGLSIVFLTFAVRLALVPIGIRQFHSMQRMAMHMPEMKKIREKYKDNPQRQQQETMAFYKENNVNPFSSCLPLLIQWPFLIGLFWTLRGNLRNDICLSTQKVYREMFAKAHHISLLKAGGQTTPCGNHGGASFLFIHDLTNKATGVSVAILLVLYIGTSIGSSMIMMMPGTEKNQRRMMLFLPVLFSLFVIRFPAGALLYYIIFNLWMIMQQSVLKQLIGKQYRHPAGAAIGITGDEGSISTGGGLRGLFGFPKEVSSDTDGGAMPNPVSEPRSKGKGRGVTGNGEPTSTPKLAPGKSSNGRTSSGDSKSRTNGAGKSGASTNGNGATARSGPPPPSPRKKKKRSGRRR
jgi:YidC/Oxa1 family membrane protein insertase